MDLVHGGQCRVSWTNVCHPKAFGGLGIPDLRLAGFALRVRWLWLQRSGHPYWDGLKALVERTVSDMFDASTFFMPGMVNRCSSRLTNGLMAAQWLPWLLISSSSCPSASECLTSSSRRVSEIVLFGVGQQLWKEWNSMVFDSALSSVSEVLQSILSEGHLWSLAGIANFGGFFGRVVGSNVIKSPD
ncbi:uncharacterized protein [Oryza sativa Japonica Group]|uniref:uncharacterized protein n=1 Tax=Oryza sativa subsp. japonica TaxID=39947 RepID=UPI00077550BA